MSAPVYLDLAGVDVEHMYGVNAGPLVKVRLTTTGVPAKARHRISAAGDLVPVVLGQMTPAQAREIAVNLLSAAARAEYEADFLTAHHEFCTTSSIPDDARDGFDAMVLGFVRSGEQSRHTGAGQ